MALITYQEAQKSIMACKMQFGLEVISTKDALGRVLAEAVFTDRPYPPFNRATMDGYAFGLADFENGVRSFKIVDEILAGKTTDKKLESGWAYKIMTGAAVPEDADTLIRREDILLHDDVIQIKVDQMRLFQNIARKGEDIGQAEELIKAGTQVDASISGALAVVGKTTVNVYKSPVISIFSTGDEVIPVADNPLPHQIRNSNTAVLTSLLLKYSIPVKNTIHMADEPSVIEREIYQAGNSDVLILTGGVSAGDADYIPGVLKKIGVREIFHGVSIRPGRPIWFGRADSGMVVFGLPGNPVSTQVAFRLFIEPFLRTCFSLDPLPSLRLPMSFPKPKTVYLDEFFPCKITNEPFGLKPLQFKTSGDITATIGSDGIAIHESERPNLEPGDQVSFLTW